MPAADSTGMTIAISPTAAPPGFAARAMPPGGAGSSAPGADSWLDALAKLIPGEVIIAFTAALQIDGVGSQRSAHLAILVVFAALCPILLWASVRQAAAAAHWLQYAVRTIAFVLYGLGADRVLMAWLGDFVWVPGVGALVVAVLAALVLSPPGARRPPS
jgi:hypothetical protein